MRFIKAFLAGIIGLFLIITLLSLLIPAKVKVTRTVLIDNSSRQKIYEQVVALKNWVNWHPSFAPGAAAISYGKISSGTNGSCDITYNNKTAHLKITDTDTSSINFSLTTTGENEVINTIHFYSITAQQTRVDWEAITQLHWYPWDKFYAIFIDKLTGGGYEAALDGLKRYTEGK